MSSFDPVTTNPDEGFQTEAIVKWFNLAKGFGFVALADGSPDAFLHSSVVNQANMREVAEGTKLLVQVAGGAKGPQVLSIIQVLGMGEVPPAPGRTAPTGPETEMTGVVKWFKPEKGFGFASSDDGDGRDVFIHRSILLRAGLQQLDPGQKVRMKVVTASKGREATSLEVIR